jgi:diamine N-acetyltransferase
VDGKPKAAGNAKADGAETAATEPCYLVEGDRVALGPLRMDLVPAYQRWSNDLEAFNANGWVLPWTLEVQRERIAGRSGKPDLLDFTVYDRSDHAPVGFTSLFHIDHRTGTAEFGILLGERRDQGLGTEATRLTLDWGFTVMGLHNIMLGVASWNERAIHVYTKAGFRELGRRRGAAVTMGRRYDGVYMDMLAEEFLRTGGSVLADRAPSGGTPPS